jgi:phage shock protein A
VEDLRSLALDVRKAGTNVKELIGLANIRRRIFALVSADKLEELLKAGESLGDKTHVEASIRMHAIEKRTGKSHDEIIADFEDKETKVNALSRKLQDLQLQKENLTSEKRKAQTEFNREKNKLNAEIKANLTQHGLTLERIEHASRIEKNLKAHGIDLAQLEELQRVLNAVGEAGLDAKVFVELAKKVSSFKTQAEVEAKHVAETQEIAAKLNVTISTLESKVAKAAPVVEKHQQLEAMGWNQKRLEKALKLATEAGDPEEALSRLELLRPAAELKAELERVKTEVTQIESRKKKLEKQHKSLKQKCEKTEKTMNALKELLNMGFSMDTLASIYSEALKYGSAPPFMEAFGRYRTLEEIEVDIARLTQEHEGLKGETEKKRRELEGLSAKTEAVAFKVGQIRAELEQKMKTVSGLQFLIAFADDPRSLNTDSAAWFAERIRIWAENKEIEVQKKEYVTSELDVGTRSRWLCESIRKLKERGY